MGTDPDHLFILLCDTFPDPDPLFLTRSRSRSMIAILPITDNTITLIILLK